MSSTSKPHASTELNYSPRKARLVINLLRGQRLDKAMELLKHLKKGKTKKFYDLLKSAAANLGLAESEYGNFVVQNIVAEEGQRLYRAVPRARGSTFRIRRRYSRIKVDLSAL